MRIVALIAVLLAALYLRKKNRERMCLEALLKAISSHADSVFMLLDGERLRVDYLSDNIEKLLGIPEEEAWADIRTVDGLLTRRGAMFDQMLTIQPEQQLEWDREYLHRTSGESRRFHGTALCREIQGRKKYLLILTLSTSA